MPKLAVDAGMKEKIEEHDDQHVENLAYEGGDTAPELHWRTYVALASMCLLQFVMLFALLGPPVALSYIGAAVDGTTQQNWIPNIPTLLQAALGPLIASASDLFQARKWILIGTCTLAFVGSAIAPGAQDIYRLMGAQILIGTGLSAVPVSYTVPSEILPRKWRPVAQGLINACGTLAVITAPLIIQAFVKADPLNGWRSFFWIQMGLWGGSALGILFGYRPPARKTHYDHLSLMQKVFALDLGGNGLLIAGATLVITGLNLGGNAYPWTSARTLAPLVVGIVCLAAFAVYERWGTKTGVLHHDLFRGGKHEGRAFAVLCILFFLEGAMFFSIAIWYPVLTSAVYEPDPLLQAVRLLPGYAPAALTTLLFGYVSSKARTIRVPLATGFLIWTGGLIGLACLQPGEGAIALGSIALVGIGLGGPLVLIIAAVQLTVQHKLMATATAVVVSSRAFGAAIFTAIYGAIVGNRIADKLPAYISRAALGAGLPPTVLGPFIGALTEHDDAALSAIPGVTSDAIGAGVAALQQAFADSVRVAFAIAAGLGLVAILCSFLLGSFRDRMDFVVEAPMERLEGKSRRPTEAA